MMILLLLILLGAGVMVLVNGGGRRTRVARGDEFLADARADASRWYERLGGQLLNLQADGDVARQALVDATERHQAAGAQLSQARTVTQYRLARESALEGLAYVRAARITLGLDPGPELPALAAAEAGTVTNEHEMNGYRVGPQHSSATPYYYPGGYQNGRPMPAGWYSTPWWKTALAAGAGTIGGMLLLDSLMGMGHHGGGGGPDIFDGDFF
ncbi:hypothetical protein ACQP2E_10780 [Actinoplanes sp. CA-015351]|uniref:hypothetical protein n=1 Tax=Actinoplanes sp. CA-015351 TaxID=3239897 RepID=UPI003D95C533